MPHPADTAFNDQANAAEADLARILDRITPQLLGDQAYDEEPAPWLLAKLDQFVTGVEAGTVQLCAHLAKATGPRPAFGVLGLNHLHCTKCLHAIKLEDGGDYLCDHCGQPAELIAPALVNLGTIALLILECDPCASHTECRNTVTKPARSEESPRNDRPEHSHPAASTTPDAHRRTGREDPQHRPHDHVRAHQVRRDRVRPHRLPSPGPGRRYRRLPGQATDRATPRRGPLGLAPPAARPSSPASGRTSR